MRCVFFALTLFVAAALTAAAGPNIKFLNEVHNFGAFDENDGTVKCRFSFVNIGDEPALIVASRATCGCTSSSYTKAPIEPGDTGYVEVSYNPTGRPGRFSKKVYVDFNTDTPRYTLIIKGVVIGASNTLRGRYPIDAGEMKLRSNSILFGEVKSGKAKSAFFEVYNATTDSISPHWTTLPRGIKVSSPVSAIGPGEQATYTVFYTPLDDMYGIYTDSLMLQSSPGQTPVKIDMIAIVDEDFSRLTPGQLRDAPTLELDGTSIDFGEIDRNGGPITRSFTIRNNGKSTMIIRRVYTTDPGITVTTTSSKIKKGKDALVNVTIDPIAVPSEILNGRISIIVNDPRNPTGIMRAVGTIK